MPEFDFSHVTTVTRHLRVTADTYAKAQAIATVGPIESILQSLAVEPIGEAKEEVQVACIASRPTLLERVQRVIGDNPKLTSSGTHDSKVSIIGKDQASLQEVRRVLRAAGFHVDMQFAAFPLLMLEVQDRPPRKNA